MIRSAILLVVRGQTSAALYRCLWRWQPAEEAPGDVPAGQLGLLQGPRLLAGHHRLHAEGLPDGLSPIRAGRTSELGERHGGLVSARDHRSRSEWAGRRIALCRGVPELLRGRVRGRQEGGRDAVSRRARWTSPRLCRPGSKHVLSLLVVGHAARRASCSRSATRNAARRGARARWRGAACAATSTSSARPPAARIADVKVDTSVRKGEITFDAALQGLAADAQYALRAAITDERPQASRSSPASRSRPATSRTAASRSPRSGSPRSSGTSTRRRTCTTSSVSLLDAGGKVLDAALPVRFGFREFWIDGRDFYLNGTPHLPLRRAAGQRPGRRRAGQLRGGQGEPAAAEELRHQLRLHAQLRLRAGHAPELRGDPAGGRRRGHARLLLAAALRPVRLEGARRRRRPTATPATPSSTSAWPAEPSRRSCSTR